MWWHGDVGWAGWLLMLTTMVVFWGLVVWAVLVVTRGLGGGERARNDPKALLAGRFAAGEIDEDEYRRRLATLHAALR